MTLITELEAHGSDLSMRAASELRRLHYLVTRREKLNDLQFDAVVRLKRLRPETATCKAARDVYTKGHTMYAAAKAHGISEAAVQGTCKSIRQALEDCYIVITGEARE